MRRALLIFVLSVCASCAKDRLVGDEPSLHDAGSDALAVDAGATDAGATDAGATDAATSIADAGADAGFNPDCLCEWSLGGGALTLGFVCGASACGGSSSFNLGCDLSGVPQLSAGCAASPACVCTSGALTLACGAQFCTGLVSGVGTHSGHGWACSVTGTLTALSSCPLN